jgi:hypothetical protein
MALPMLRLPFSMKLMVVQGPSDPVQSFPRQYSEYHQLMIISIDQGEPGRNSFFKRIKSDADAEVGDA